MLALTAFAAHAIIYLPALHATYRLDDYAWLSLANTLFHGRSLLWALFAPAAQGTIRPLGERAWFLIASRSFGSNPAPLHALALVVQCLNIALVIAVGRRLIGSSLGACVAGLLWAINSVLVEPIVWASALNEVLFACLFLSTFYSFLRWIDSRRPIWLVVHATAFLFALCTLETSVTFPALAAIWVFLSRRGTWRDVVPSATGSLVYTALHLTFAKLPSAGPYAMTFGWSIVANLWRYWVGVLGPEGYFRAYGGSLIPVRVGSWLMAGATLLWAGSSARRHNRLPAFGIAWFITTLAPLLPLLNHFTYYYTFVPSIGLAWLGASALVLPTPKAARALALSLVGAYTAYQIPTTIAGRDWFLEQSRAVARQETKLREHVQEIRQEHSAGPVFLQGLDMEQFWWGLCYGQLLREGFSDVHAMPDAGNHGVPIPPREWCYREDFQFSPEETRRLLKRGGYAYDITGPSPKPISHLGF